MGGIKPVLALVDISNLIASYWSTLIIEGNIINFSQKQGAQKLSTKTAVIVIFRNKKKFDSMKFHEDFNANFER